MKGLVKIIMDDRKIVTHIKIGETSKCAHAWSFFVDNKKVHGFFSPLSLYVLYHSTYNSEYKMEELAKSSVEVFSILRNWKKKTCKIKGKSYIIFEPSLLIPKDLIEEALILKELLGENNEV